MKSFVQFVAVVTALGFTNVAHAASTAIGEPYYAYFLREWYETNPAPQQNGAELRRVDSGVQSGGTLLRTHDMGQSVLGFPALGMVAGYDDGRTFWSQTLSPLRSGAERNLIGGQAEINIAQSYRKDTADATLSFSFTAGKLQLLEYGSQRGDGYSLSAYVTFAANLVDHGSAELRWSERQLASLYEEFNVRDDRTDNTWGFTRTQETGPTSSGMSPWQWNCDECGGPAYGFATATLQAPFAGVVDLSSIDVGDEFTVSFYLMTSAFDARQGETSALAYARDPLSTDDSGVGFTFAGLTPTDRPIIAVVPEPSSAALMLAGLALGGVMFAHRIGRSMRLVRAISSKT